jgi:Ca-activated chloride channel family protein
LSFALLIADPNLKKQNKQVVKNGIDIAIVLDLSYSMVAEDIPPNRLEVAKQVISDFTSKLTTDRVGLVLFSGKPFTSVPLTFDYQFITDYVKEISIESINQDYTHLQ